jgi:sterol desaturase/sphingolipid hydroxylase (fatty acid hydroxylase superfamily)
MNRLVAFSAIAVLYSSLFLLERLFPLRRPHAPLLPRFVINAFVSALAFAAGALVVQPIITRMLHWTAQRPFGLTRLAGLPAPMELALGALLLDLSFYYWHVTNHGTPFLWRFHNVHHIDPDLDVTTAFRFHFGEVALSAAFRAVQIGVIGPSFATFAIYSCIFQAATLFHHSNVRLPIGLERLLNRMLVTPRMHGIHHSQFRGEDNSNFGIVFPWWDRIHRTLGLNVPHADIAIGVPAYTMPGDTMLRHCLCVPFQRQRDYWKTPDGEVRDERTRVPVGPRSRLAE